VINRSNLIYSIMIQRGIVVPEYEEVTEEGKSSSVEETLSAPSVSKERVVPSY
jgi:hypothetical protein